MVLLASIILVFATSNGVVTVAEMLPKIHRYVYRLNIQTGHSIYTIIYYPISIYL